MLVGGRRVCVGRGWGAAGAADLNSILLTIQSSILLFESERHRQI